MIITTSDDIPGKKILKTIGIVRGNTIRCRHLGHDIVAQIRNMVGGEVSDYTKMIAEAREQALDRLQSEAMSQGANAVIALRFSTSYIMAGAAELLAYGTAVVVED
ncbi:MAG: heavy metal-binding domain-containing protein [candidate division Zixibacteria bacterium]|nr:heavy metal-binding domain-containing protein [candidate division Zixibacteria bacterium]